MPADLPYAMSSFLMFRAVADTRRWFSDAFPPYHTRMPETRAAVRSGGELLDALQEQIDGFAKGKKLALALSGGIDSAILLKLMPPDTIAYTLRCTLPGAEVIDETAQAGQHIAYAAPHIAHKTVPVLWEDMETLSPSLMRHKGAPIHSIEVQIYKLAAQAKSDGCDAVVFGETADCLYGGHSKLLARDWTFGEFVDRWSFVPPYQALKNPRLILDPFWPFVKDGYVDVPGFLADFQAETSLNSYTNACALAGIELFAPYAHTVRGAALDLSRIRGGENKYIVREAFQKLYPGRAVPPKLPMPRPMNEWLQNWPGPARREFWPHCTAGMTGDQKWLVRALERFLNLFEEEKPSAG